MGFNRYTVLNKVIITVFAMVLLIGNLNIAHASSNISNHRFLNEEWGEFRTASFVIIYPLEYWILAQSTFDLYGDLIEYEYSRFVALYQDELTIPISIRIYPELDDYYRLNALAPMIDEGVTHSHIGTREIALIGEAIISDFAKWQSEAINSFRFEISMMFVEKITGGKAPPGFLTGASTYTEDPIQTFPLLYSYSGLGAEPDMSWQYLWENPDDLNLPKYTLQVTSTIAYLIDIYGWEKYLDLLQSFSTANGYRQALMATYEISIQEISEQWQTYFPIYIQGRWRSNVFHSFDLSAFEDLLQAGAYIDAVAGLQDAIRLLEATEDDEKLQFAQSMLADAITGVEAGALISQSRQALLDKDYESCIYIADKSIAMYQQLGDDRRLEEIFNYRNWAQEVVDLREELEVLNAQGPLGRSSILTRLVDIGQRLGELDDQEGVGLVVDAIEDATAEQETLYQNLSIGGAIIVIILLFRIIWTMRRPLPPEAQLR
jgi:hypothetical protein